MTRSPWSIKLRRPEIHSSDSMSSRFMPSRELSSRMRSTTELRTTSLSFILGNPALNVSRSQVNSPSFPFSILESQKSLSSRILTKYC